MPATGVTTGVPSAAAMSWPWWVWPGRPTPKRASGPPKLNGPWTGKIFEPVVAVESAAGAGVAGAAWARRRSAARGSSASRPAPVTTRRAVYFPAATAARQVAADAPAVADAAELDPHGGLAGRDHVDPHERARRGAQRERHPRAGRDRRGRDAVKLLAVGPASVPPLRAEAAAGGQQDERGASSDTDHAPNVGKSDARCKSLQEIVRAPSTARLAREAAARPAARAARRRGRCRARGSSASPPRRERAARGSSPGRSRSRAPRGGATRPRTRRPRRRRCRPRLWARSIVERTIAASDASTAISITNDLSILITSTGSRLRLASDE